VAIRGDTASWKDTTDARHFCPSCGSALFDVSDSTGEIEIRLGAIDAAPTYCDRNRARTEAFPSER
jgi:hypothetical protein